MSGFDSKSVKDRFRSAGTSQGWWDSGKAVLAAVSGGSDSMSMLWLLRFFWKGMVYAAHLEHGFREETAIRDAHFVEEICCKWGVDCRIEHRNVPSLKMSGETLEEAGRRERYDFLRKVSRETGAGFIATGHTADDSTETIFFNLLRGTGIRGLRGIPEVRGEIVRPVIRCGRSELQSFLSERSVPWVTDESNDDVSYFRNRIRHVIFPFIHKEGNPRFREHLMALGGEVSVTEEARENKAASLAAWARRSFPLVIRVWSRKTLLSMSKGDLQSLFAFEGRDLGLSPLSRVKTDTLLELVTGPGNMWRFQWERDLEICGSGKMVALVTRTLPEGEHPAESRVGSPDGSGSFCWGPWRLEWISAEETQTPSSGDFSCVMPVSKVENLEIRSLKCLEKAKKQHGRVPWWCISNWPMVKSAGYSWSPLEGFLDKPGMTGGGQMFRFRVFEVRNSKKGDHRYDICAG
ncbi:MAG TPA: tRNA lysidine(34) synthetase TilS [Synergistetes bacterium]|nr:tRNA lysidine(34) synthetase TilS [Synergistota bacterium]